MRQVTCTAGTGLGVAVLWRVPCLLFPPAFLRRSPLLAQDVLTCHNDNSRTGQALTEEILTTSNGDSAQSGKLYQVNVDGKVDAQPLYASAVAISSQGVHNVLIAATEHGSVYTFDRSPRRPVTR